MAPKDLTATDHTSVGACLQILQVRSGRKEDRVREVSSGVRGWAYLLDKPAAGLNWAFPRRRPFLELLSLERRFVGNSLDY